MLIRFLAMLFALAATHGATIHAAAAQVSNTPQQRPEFCTQEFSPVCGEKNGATKTYPNACVAASEGAKVIAKEPCRAPPGPASR